MVLEALCTSGKRSGNRFAWKVVVPVQAQDMAPVSLRGVKYRHKNTFVVFPPVRVDESWKLRHPMCIQHFKVRFTWSPNTEIEVIEFESM